MHANIKKDRQSKKETQKKRHATYNPHHAETASVPAMRTTERLNQKSSSKSTQLPTNMLRTPKLFYSYRESAKSNSTIASNNSF